MLGYFISALSLSWALFARAVGAKYRKSFLGYFWMVSPAVVVSVGACVAHNSGLLRPGVTSLSYPVFVFIGTLLWQTFAEAATLAHQAVEGARSYLTRVQFPREAVILAHSYELFFVALVRVLVALVFMAFAGNLSFYSASMLLWAAVIAVMLGLGISMLTMPFTILFSDFYHTVKLILGYGIFLTPAMYLPDGNGLFALIVRYNPVSPLMQAARDAASGGPLTSPTSFAVVTGAAVLCTVIGTIFVRISTPIVVERMLIGGK